MKIILLANEKQKEELVANGENLPAEMIWFTRISQVDITNADACIDMLFDDTKEHIKKLGQLETKVIIINAVVKPFNKPVAGFIRINGWNTFLKRQIIEAAGNDDVKKKVEEIFSFFNKTIEWVADITGFISPRVVASIINEAYFALEQQVSTKEEIDTAMKLGTNYPYGPFEWGEKIGLHNIYQLLRSLAEEEKRYEPAVLLTKEAIV